MIHNDYLRKGLNALSRAHQVNTMAGHLGAAVIAGWLISQQHPVCDAAVVAGIEGELERIIKGESVFSPKPDALLTVAEMFAPYEESSPQPQRVQTIARSLAQNISALHQSGHNVIFASIAIRALTDQPQLANPALVEGINQHILDFNGTGPGSGYYGKQRGRIDGRKIRLPDDESSPPYDDLAGMVAVLIDEVIHTAREHRTGYGGLWHLINHTAALVELANQGYHVLALQGLPAQWQHVRLYRTLPNLFSESGERTPAMHHLFEVAYWTGELLRRDSALLTHRLKTLYAFELLLPYLTSIHQQQVARDEFLYLM